MREIVRSRPDERKIGGAVYGKWLFAVSMAGLVLMYFLLLVAPFENWMSLWETAATRGLNGLTLTDAVWDWTVLILSSNFWLLFILVVALCGAIAGSVRAISHDYGRAFGYVVIAFAIAFAAEEISDKISDTIIRRPPIQAIVGLNDVVAQYDARIEIPDDTGLPDENVTGLACLAFLFMWRFRRTSLLILACTAMHCIGQLSIGHRWFFDLFSSFLMGGAFAGTSLKFGKHGIAWCERKMEGFLLPNIWWALPHAWTRSFKFSRLYQTRRTQTLIDSDREKKIWARVIQSDVAPLFVTSEDSFRLREKPAGKLPKRWRPSCYVRFLYLPSGERFVVKMAHQRPGMWHRSKRVRRYAESAHCNIALARLGFPVPRLYWAKEGFLSGTLRRYFVLVEEYLDGRPIDIRKQHEIESAMEMLARMHSHESEYWGGLAHLNREPHVAYVWKTLRPYIAGLLRRISYWYGDRWPEGLNDRIWKQFEAAAVKLMEDTPPCFRLTHGDVGVRNFMWDGERIRLIDFLTVGYDLPGPEILRATRVFGNGSAEQKSRLWQKYFDAAGPLRWAEFKAQANLSLARFALRELAQDRIDGFSKAALPQPADISRWLETILHLDADVWGAEPALTDWEYVSAALLKDHAGDDGKESLTWVEARALPAPPVNLHSPALDKSSLHICHIASHEGVYRGGAVQLCRMAEAQRRRGHRVTVVTNRPKDVLSHQADMATWHGLERQGIAVVPIDLTEPAGIMKLRRLFQLGVVDVVHAHRDEALEAAWTALEDMERPVLVAQRGTISSASDMAGEALRSERTRAIVAVAEAVKQETVRTSNVPDTKIQVVYGSVDVERFAPREPARHLRETLGIPSGAVVIGSLSAYRKAKGFEILLPALAQVLAARPDLYAIFIGKGVKDKLEPLAAELAIDKHCRFMDHQEDVAQWLSIMDLTVIAATDREGLSGVLRESLAMEVPVISTDCAGNGEIVRHEETGLLVPVGNVDALAGALGWALDHPEAMRAMAQRGRAWVQANCSIEVQAERLEAVYRRCLKEAGAKSDLAAKS